MKNLKYDGNKRRLASMVYKSFDKKTSGSAATLVRSETLATRKEAAIKNENVSNKELAKELHKLIFEKFKKGKVQSPFIDNIWGDDLSDMQLIGKFNKVIGILLCVIEIFGKHA